VTTAPPVLWQFRFSHYNEKARWALDLKGIAHVRRSLLPGFHVPRVLWMTGQKALPVLIVDGETIHDSTRIIERLERLRPEPALYPADDAARRRALALEDFFDEELGPHVRRALFHELLPETEFAAAAFTLGFGPDGRLNGIGELPELPDVGPTRLLPLGTPFGARSGDKGGNANIGVWARRDDGYRWLEAFLTVDRLRELLPDSAKLKIDRYPLPGIRSLNFVVIGLLGEGVASSTRIDPQAKGLGEYLRSRIVDLPEALLEDAPAAAPRT